MNLLCTRTYEFFPDIFLDQWAVYVLGAPTCGSGPNWCLEGPPPHPPLWLEDPSLKPNPFPLRPLLPSSPHPPWLFLQGGGGEGVLGRKGVGGGPPSGAWGQTHIWGTRTWGAIFRKLEKAVAVSGTFSGVIRKWGAPQEGAGTLVPRENCRKVSKRLLALLDDFWRLLPCAKSVEKCRTCFSSSAKWWFSLRMIWDFWGLGVRTSWQSSVRPK